MRQLFPRVQVGVGPKGVPYVNTHDGRTLRYPDPRVSLHDTVILDIESGKMTDYLKFEPGSFVDLSLLRKYFLLQAWR